MIKSKPPEQTLTCKEAPGKPIEQEYTQKHVARLITDLYYAWKDCWEKLEKVKLFVSDEA